MEKYNADEIVGQIACRLQHPCTAWYHNTVSGNLWWERNTAVCFHRINASRSKCNQAKPQGNGQINQFDIWSKYSKFVMYSLYTQCILYNGWINRASSVNDCSFPFSLWSPHTSTTHWLTTPWKYKAWFEDICFFFFFIYIWYFYAYCIQQVNRSFLTRISQLNKTRLFAATKGMIHCS